MCYFLVKRYPYLPISYSVKKASKSKPALSSDFKTHIITNFDNEDIIQELPMYNKNKVCMMILIFCLLKELEELLGLLNQGEYLDLIHTYLKVWATKSVTYL